MKDTDRIKNLGLAIENEILDALALSEEHEMKALPLDRQIANILGLVRRERERCAQIIEGIPFENDGQEYCDHLSDAVARIRNPKED